MIQTFSTWAYILIFFEITPLVPGISSQPRISITNKMGNSYMLQKDSNVVPLSLISAMPVYKNKQINVSLIEVSFKVLYLKGLSNQMRGFQPF